MSYVQKRTYCSSYAHIGYSGTISPWGTWYWDTTHIACKVSENNLLGLGEDIKEFFSETDELIAAKFSGHWGHRRVSAGILKNWVNIRFQRAIHTIPVLLFK